MTLHIAGIVAQARKGILSPPIPAAYELLLRGGGVKSYLYKTPQYSQEEFNNPHAKLRFLLKFPDPENFP